ncbi:uncharacterized protein LOC125501064 [Athalia rosae]|uniref:uncharacterized protein LOC125501064 n=1 Tax=Athalia rosae TaxID=37344 RepID=UPI0020340088|nr:uncharacterized protein LOC125501064 [Athalia rosae]
MTNKGQINKLYEPLRLEHSDSEEEKSMEKLMVKHSDCFYIPGETFNFTPVPQHRITTVDNQPVNTRQYWFSPIHKSEINLQVGELKDKQIVTSSELPYNTLIWIVPEHQIPKEILHVNLLARKWKTKNLHRRTTVIESYRKNSRGIILINNNNNSSNNVMIHFTYLINDFSFAGETKVSRVMKKNHVLIGYVESIMMEAVVSMLVLSTGDPPPFNGTH